MPSSSQRQHNFMEAIAHSAKFAKQAGVPVSVGQDFAAADKKIKKFAGGGPVQGPLTQSRNLLTQTVVQPSDVAIRQGMSDEHLNAVIGRSVSDPTFRESYPELKDSDLSQSYAQGGSVQDPIAARLHHIIFVKPLDQIDEHDHAFINSLIQKGRK